MWAVCVGDASLRFTCSMHKLMMTKVPFLCTCLPLQRRAPTYKRRGGRDHACDCPDQQGF
jgi:hypothetical protein